MKFDVSPAVWQFWSLSALALIMLAALLTDLRRRCIPNKLILLTLCAGLLTHVLGPVNDAGGLFSDRPGALGAKGVLAGALTGLTLFLPLYALRAMGAGDVKLMAGIGSFAGPADTLNVAVVILLMGGVLSVARMLLGGTTRHVMANVMLVLSPVLHGGPRQFDAAKHSVDRMPYALAMVTGLLAYGSWLWLGGSPLFRF
ncbi:prepilin peptidase [Ramlibacter sp. 2FC]|uniref:A24 family peptidase n=1 Tax=Ramlibacter sp. 2FC TaxID=2502188 RepID=UPI0010F5B842|nr:prepilin peptidase [Ramlibacter sp. 2FC]